jgi:hypothetical protein
LKLEAPYIPEIRTDLNDNPSITEQDAIVQDNIRAQDDSE